MKGILKWPLIIAAVLVVARVITEQLGAPDGVSNALSVAVFYVIIAPVYFALRIAKSDVDRPYATLLKTTALFTTLARAMVIPTYWLAYIYQWPQPRFNALTNGGVVGPNVTPLTAYVVVPLAALAIWVVGSVIVGGGIGSIIIATKRRAAVKSHA